MLRLLTRQCKSFVIEEGLLADPRPRGFPPEFILPVSTIARATGFMAHWKEAMGRFSLRIQLKYANLSIAGSARIWRPGQIYTGHLDRTIDT